MCGICATVGSGPADAATIRTMMAALSHRGPDAEGSYVSGHVGLGHRRLSIIDQAGGGQPMTNEDETLRIVFNGEIYNHAELRAELTQRGHGFRTRSDTEVILHLYEEHGAAAVTRLRGMFAFVIWESRTGRAFAARDHLGQKPLYYVERDGELWIASEIKALLAADPTLREVDPDALDEYLALRLVAAPRSMFRRIKKVPPAHTLTYDVHTGLNVARYWKANYEPKWTGRETDLLDDLEEHIVEALRVHLVSDVPVGAFLSGGLDSGLIVALLRRRGLVDDLQTFSVGLPYGSYDESGAARQVAQANHTRHHEARVQPSLLRDLPRIVAQLDEPSDPLAVCLDLVAALAAQHVKVVLGGDGGDELFGGYDRYFGNHYADQYGRIPRLFREGVIGPGLALMPDGRWYKSVAHQLKWLHRLARYEGGERYLRSLEYFYASQPLRRELSGPRLQHATDRSDAGRVMREAFEEMPDRELVDRMLYADLHSRLPDHPVMIQDRMTMAHGLEARSPFMDHRLVEFVARLPVHLKLRGRTLRYAQLQLARRHLPADVVARKKQGFASALPYLLRDELRHLQQLVLHDMALVEDGYLHAPAVQRLWHEHTAGRVDHGQRLWLLVNAELWYRLCIRQEPRSSVEARLQQARPFPQAA